MQVITPRGLKLYARCPKRFSFSWHLKPVTTIECKTIEDIIKSLYLYHARRGVLMPWKHIPPRAHQMLLETFKDLDATQEYKQTEHLLVKLSAWYNNHYLEEYCDEGVINLPVQMGLGTHLTLADEIDIVTMGKQLRLFDFDEVCDKQSLSTYTGLKVYNDLAALAKVWLFWKATDIMPEQYIRLVISAKSVKPIRLTITDRMVEKIEVFMRQLARGIQDEAYYPSFSEQCLHCPYKERCSI